MITYKVNVAGIEMILPIEALEYIESRGWQYTEVEIEETTHNIEEFMSASLTEILSNINI